ncbi:galactose-1-epimerase [Psychromonas antarctica]|uniref:galactose-1-epimerase n=1 Tax=Psychromonas antarctica TaxID=67573 RepID=UPI001EE92E58|nr:galactose-1-epimerase [Psychromonas antarctica]MCG6200691.1 galactose-1-epimerase [Psychromonas antarctica]
MSLTAVQQRLQKSMLTEPALDGQPAKLFVLKNKQGMCVTLMDIGATWLSCEIPVATQMREMLLGVSSMADHLRQRVYFGATVGRFANRIARGQFAIDGKVYQVQTNQGGNTLHGGPQGFDQRRWNAIQHDQNSVSFSLSSPDGDQGFPGNLQVRINYQLSEDNTLTLNYQAITDKACPVNLTNHAYFNLMGSDAPSCLDSQLMIQADHYLATDKNGIPKGDFCTVQGSSFDFTELKTIGRDLMSEPDQHLAAGYDHSFLIKKSAQNGCDIVAKSISADGKVVLNVRTTKPALQLYSGNYLAGAPRRNGGEYQNYAGFALETQFLPDAPNHPEWDQPSPILAAGEQYHYQTSYQFEIQD